MSAVVTSDGLETVSVQVQTKCQWSDLYKYLPYSVPPVGVLILA